MYFLEYMILLEHIYFFRWLYFGEKSNYDSHVCTVKTNGHRYRKLLAAGTGNPTHLVAAEDRLIVGEEHGGIYVYHIQGEGGIVDIDCASLFREVSNLIT